MKVKKMKLKRGHKLSVETIPDAVGFTLRARVNNGTEAVEASFSWSPIAGWYYEGTKIGFVSWRRMWPQGPAGTDKDRELMANAFVGDGIGAVFERLEALL